MIYSKLQYKVIIGGWNDSARSKCNKKSCLKSAQFSTFALTLLLIL